VIITIYGQGISTSYIIAAEKAQGSVKHRVNPDTVGIARRGLNQHVGECTSTTGSRCQARCQDVKM